MRTIFVIGASALCFSTAAMAVSTKVNMSYFGGTLKDNTGTAPLSSGNHFLNGDGALFELGYFDGDTASFTGNWVALTGPNSNNSSLITTIGDFTSQTGSPTGGTDVGDGIFAIAVNFDSDTSTTNGPLPASGAQLALRFYDGATRGSSGFYNTATSVAWTWSPPASPAPTTTFVDLDSTSNVPVWEDAANAFSTSKVVPEPSSTALLGLGGLAFFIRRRR